MVSTGRPDHDQARRKNLTGQPKRPCDRTNGLVRSLGQFVRSDLGIRLTGLVRSLGQFVRSDLGIRLTGLVRSLGQFVRSDLGIRLTGLVRSLGQFVRSDLGIDQARLTGSGRPSPVDRVRSARSPGHVQSQDVAKAGPDQAVPKYPEIP
ncbi:hypothetical protein AK812_SmicGene15279 [Symbiodinium microadriaticum]|uniref:Uncharacterized protein n=1 Tax=Symbiodinium microadriaticum TaxID=2951 RepID=A0A1Q9E3D8_SYMMI|nr:hypothetical protein AK812_SmicGene15279 [Symbiodinium microadriaticum]